MRLYLKYLSIHVKGVLQYKASFFLMSLGQFLTAFGLFLSIGFLFTRFQQVDGYTFPEVLLCASVVMTAFSLAELFGRGFDVFQTLIGNGEFDRMLVRPRGLILQVLGSRFELTRWAKLLQAILLLLYSIFKNGIGWTPVKLLGLLGMVLGGASFFAGLFIVYAAFCFFTLEGLEFMNIFTDGGKEMGRYPVSIYGKWALRFFTYILPLACFQYYPLLYLTGRWEAPSLLLLPLLCFLFPIPCLLFWRFGLRHYQSTGS